MANQTGGCTLERAKKNIIEEDRYVRWKVVGTTADQIQGEVWVRKDVAFAAGDTLTLTAA